MTHNDKQMIDFAAGVLKNLPAPEDGDAVGELRRGLVDMRPGMKLMVHTRTKAHTAPWTVDEVTQRRDGIEIRLDGPRGATYRIRDSAELERPAVDYLDPRDGWKPKDGTKDGELHAFLIVGFDRRQSR